MSTENDNLPKADGQEENNLPQQNPEFQENSPQQKPSDEKVQESSDEISEEKIADNQSDRPKLEEQGPENDSTSTENASGENLNVQESITDENETGDHNDSEHIVADEVSKKADFDEAADQDQHHDEEKDKEEDEDESDAVALKDYEEMSLVDMVKEAGSLLAAYSPLLLRDAFNGLRDAFRKKLGEEEDAAREKFMDEGGNLLDFRHDNRHATKFFDYYTEYRTKVDEHYKQQQAEQEANLKEREAIIDELKALYTEPSANNREIFKKFRDLKTRWHNAGRIPKAQAGNIFKTYYFHLDNFNEFLDLNQELRKMDYEHNLEIRRSIIERAQKLLKEENVQKALNELQYLHRMWKEEAVPVAEEYREPTWQEFKELTGKIHDRKNELNEKMIQRQAENLEKKRDVINRISNLIGDEVPKSHNAWQRKIKEMKVLRDEFFALGRVPREENQPTWDAFKEASRTFNHEKNNFYKQMKEEQMENLEKKRKLVEIANEHKDSKDWNESVKVVKRIQAEWKKIGHVPRKFSDSLWKEFSEANNKFFDRYKNRNNEKLEKQQHNLEIKEAILKEMEKAEKPKEKAALLEWLNNYNIKWSAVGFVPNGKQDINKEFSALAEKILTEAGLDKNAVEAAQWESQIERIKSTLDERTLRNMKYDLRKQVDEVQKEVTHLQTNLAFFSNADDSNPLFKNAIQNIENKVNELKSLESKLDDLKHINLEALAESQKAEAEAKAAREAEEAAVKEAEEAAKIAEENSKETSKENLNETENSEDVTQEESPKNSQEEE